ncbi:hypothetical protein IFR05_006121 [Cadophora sp. M221]|nr:hypothetical protein IFR05_006121 [Cadophora sp. M221]
MKFSTSLTTALLVIVLLAMEVIASPAQDSNIPSGYSYPIAPGKLTGHYNGIPIDATSLDEVIAQITAKDSSFNLTEIVAARKAVEARDNLYKLVNINQIDPIIGLIGVTADVEWYVPARHCSDFNIQTAQAIMTICNYNYHDIYPETHWIATHAQGIINKCRFIGQAGGQEFDSDGWNVIVRNNEQW